MKRCSQCHRVESDDALKFCRFDGATLAIDSSSIDQEVGTLRLDSGQVTSEKLTGVLPHRTDANIYRATTTALPSPPARNTHNGLSKPKRTTLIVAPVIATVVVAAVCVVLISSYRSRNTNAGLIQSIAVKRVETDETLKFCRVDGATLLNDSSSIGSEAGTAELGASSNADEVHTNIHPHRTVEPYTYAAIYAGLGDKDRALAELERDIGERGFYVTYLRVDPMFDPLRDDPRLISLLKRVGLQQ